MYRHIASPLYNIPLFYIVTAVTTCLDEGLVSALAVSLVPWIWFETDHDSGSEGCFSQRLSTDLNLTLRVAFYFFRSPLSDHFTHHQLGEDDLVWEAAFCHSDTVVILDELREQGLSAGAVCLLKYAGVCPAAPPLKCQGFSRTMRGTLQMVHNTMTPCLVTTHLSGLSPCTTVADVEFWGFAHLF